MKLELIHYVLAFLGLAIYLVTSLIKAGRTHKEDFNYRVWFKDNILSLVLSVLSVVALMISIDELVKLPVIPEQIKGLIKIVSIVIGYANFSLIKKVLDIAIPKKLKK